VPNRQTRTRILARTSAAIAALSVSIGAALAVVTPASASTPAWVQHVQNYPGGITNGVRAYATPEYAAAQSTLARARAQLSSAPTSQKKGGLHNVQMNDNTNPPVPQNETSVAASLANPLVAVAGANDYVFGGVTVMRTTDGGNTWSTVRVVPQFRGTGDFCTGGDPWIAYSRRDKAFYMSQLCFFRALPFSEVHLFKSIDNGQTWTPGRFASLVDTNFNYATRTVDDTIFHDNDQVAVDNNPSSPHYGRIYVTHVKFHIVLPSGFSDYCPVQLAYTDNVPTANPRSAVWQHTKVVPDNPGGNGLGPTANQWPRPVVEKNGTLDIAYALEDCNSALDTHFNFQKSTNGGASFMANPVQIDGAGEYVDNPDPGDILAPTKFRAPDSTSLSYNQARGTLGFVYQNSRNADTSGANISFESSADGGHHWSAMKYISITPSGAPAPGDQFFPALTSLSNGTFVAIWLDRRHDPRNHDIETFQGVSTNGGATWTNQDISTTSWNPDHGFFTSGAFIGDYAGIASSTEAIYPVWTDGRNTQFSVTGSGSTDIFTNVERQRD
jgi:hypothetical protein